MTFRTVIISAMAVVLLASAAANGRADCAICGHCATSAARRDGAISRW